MKIGIKIILPLLILLSLLVGSLIFLAISTQRDGQAVRQTVDTAREINGISQQITSLQKEIDASVIAYRFVKNESYVAVIARDEKRIDELVERMGSFLTSSTGQDILNRYKSSLVGSANARADVIASSRSGSSSQQNLDFAKWIDAFRINNATQTDLVNFSLTRLEVTSELYRDITNRTFQIAWVTAILAPLLFILLYAYLNKVIVRPIRILSGSSLATAKQDFDHPITNYGNDELGELALTFNKMNQQLKQLYQNLDEKVKEKTQALESANLNLLRSNRELQDFAHVASHDLQEPLRKIQTFGDRLATKYSGSLPSEGKEYLGRMMGAAGRMSALINDLLSFSRITTKGQPFEPVDLNKIAQEVISDLEIAIEQGGAAITVDKLPTVNADPMQMRQLFQNLLSNSLKYRSPEKSPVISISATPLAKEKETCHIEFKDNGIGFEQQYAEKIFDVFQRLHGREEFEGTGVGLAICRKIVERHGGTITAQSTPSEGTTFTVSLPQKQLTEENS
ncbi:MAG: histidine kinase [Patescibacteria group bacterium]|jgi:signal transduction histidine kinase|nr:histidine kinase [Patescibacteria group bacterium]